MRSDLLLVIVVGAALAFGEQSDLGVADLLQALARDLRQPLVLGGADDR